VNENCLLQVTTAVLRTRIFGRNPWHEADLKIDNPHVSCKWKVKYNMLSV